jgi:hypothetical protein
MSITVIDRLTIQAVASGQAPNLAEGLRQRNIQGSEIWTTAENARYFRGPLGTDAQRKVMTDFKVQSPASDAYAESVVMRNRTDRLPLDVRADGALALHLSEEKRADAEVMTTDPAFRSTWARYYGKVAPETNQYYTSPVQAARQQAQAEKQPAAESQSSKLKRLGGALMNENTAVILLQGVNFIVQKINDAIQKKALDAKWAQLEPYVRSTLDEDPSLGVLLLVYYSKYEKVGPEHETPLEHTAVFQTIVPVFGYTQEDALWNAQNGPVQLRETGPGAVVGDKFWYPPKKPLDVTKLRTPFEAAGLATFVPGREKLVRVKFSGILGFDDKLWSVAKVDVPAGVVPRFLYLIPPREVLYLRNGRYDGVELDADDVPAGKANDGILNRVGALNLDSSINPYDGKGVMVFPADNATMEMFKAATGPTQDWNNLLTYYRMELLRWVRPADMWILRSFIQEDADEDMAAKFSQAEGANIHYH